MAYLTYEEYLAFGHSLEETDFNRLGYDAQRYVDIHTTGIDNVKKLRVAFPTDEDDAEAVKRCVARLVDLLNDIEKATKATGIVTDGDGTSHGAVASVSSGSESISYLSGSDGNSIIKASMSEMEKKLLIASEVKHYLSGVTDANGVNLLYMGRYPYVLR